MRYSSLLMKKIQSIDEFKSAKSAFVAKHGSELMYAAEAQRRNMLTELTPLAVFSAIPAERLLTAIAQACAHTIIPSSGERAHDEVPALRSVP